MAFKNKLNKKKLEKLDEVFLIVRGNIKPSKIPFQLRQWKPRKTIWASHNRIRNLFKTKKKVKQQKK